MMLDKLEAAMREAPAHFSARSSSAFTAAA
jgi:hypothetical protein